MKDSSILFARHPWATTFFLPALLCAACGNRDGVGAAASSTGTAPALIPALSGTSWSWDFEDVSPGALPEGWRVDATHPQARLGIWKVLREVGAPSGEKVLSLAEIPAPASACFNLCWTDRVNFLDGRISVRFAARGGEEDQGGGVIWRVEDPDDYFIARFNPLENNFRIYSVKDGSRHMLASADVSLAAGDWHLLIITQDGDHFTGSLDGKELLEGHSDAFPYAGGVGLWTKADATTSFDDFLVESSD